MIFICLLFFLSTVTHAADLPPEPPPARVVVLHYTCKNLHNWAQMSNDSADGNQNKTCPVCGERGYADGFRKGFAYPLPVSAP
jgi:hypothetical protein